MCWVIFLIRASYHGGSIKDLLSVDVAIPKSLPSLSIVFTARNEEANLEQSLPSLLGIDYPHFEIIAVNDRSTDQTGEVIEKYAAQDVRLKSIHIAELPDGWLGKVHALDQAMQMTSGDWVLFTDADLVFENQVLKKAVAYAEHERLDHLALLPETHEDSGGFLLTLFVVAFGGMFVNRIKAAKISKDGSEAFGGVGAFNLVRRSKFLVTPGFEWLRMEVLDDVGLGMMVKKAGGRSAILNGKGMLHLEWYNSLLGAIKGLEKNAFAGFARYSFFRAVMVILSMALLLLLPFCFSVVAWNWLIFLIVVICYSGLPALGALLRGDSLIDWRVGALLPLGYLFILWALLRSAILAWKQKGIRWRETFYPLEELRAGQRVKL
jgi:glycosyltransferase involved in cell wall biosynthesis